MYRVLSFSALSFAIKFLVGFVLTKLFAFFLGPSGLGVLGNLKNFNQLLASLGSLGMQRGTKYTTTLTCLKLLELC